MSDNIPVVAVDFDGCLYWGDGKGGIRPADHVIAALRVLRERGWRIMIYSCRPGASTPVADRKRITWEMIGYLLENDIPFDTIWGIRWAWIAYDGEIHTAPADMTFQQFLETADPTGPFRTRGIELAPDDLGKPAAEAYLDDRAVPVMHPRLLPLGTESFAEQEQALTSAIIGHCEALKG